MNFGQTLKVVSIWLGLGERASIALSALVVFVMMCLVFVDVVGRKLFNSPVQGSVEVTQLALPAIVYLGIAYVQARREHIRLELFSSQVSNKVNWLLELTGTTLQLVICTLITIQIGRMAWLSWSISEHTMGIVEIPIWPAKSAVFMGFLLLSLRLVIQFLEMLIDKKEQPGVPGLGGN